MNTVYIQVQKLSAAAERSIVTCFWQARQLEEVTLAHEDLRVRHSACEQDSGETNVAGDSTPASLGCSGHLARSFGSAWDDVKN